MRWLYLLSATTAVLQLCFAKEQLPIKLPSYFLPGTVEKLTKDQKAIYYEDFHDAKVEHFMEYKENLDILLKISDNEKTPCVTSIIKTLQDYQKRESYALQMNDAMGRRESGLYKGNIWWFGRFYECRSVENSEINPNLYVLILAGVEDATYGLMLGLCLPGVCQSDELEDIFQNFVPGNGTYITVVDPPTELTLDPIDIAAIVVFSFIGALVLCGTIVHMVLNKKANRKSTLAIIQNEEEAMPTSLRLALSFSIIRNTHILLDTNRKQGNLSALDGIRFISMAWVILGNTLLALPSITDNIGDVMNIGLRNGSVMPLINGTFAVDTFFMISGLLVAYLGMREMERRNGKINVPLMYLNRYIRLTPCLGAVIFFTVSLFNNIGNGPIYNLWVEHYDVEVCQKYWWADILYINNFYPEQGDMCNATYWYIANDMQFYLLSPIFLLLFYKSKKASACVVSVVVLASAATTGALSAVYNILPDVVSIGYSLNYFTSLNYSTLEFEATAEPRPDEGDGYFADIYTKPWCRIGTYMVGMATGYFLYVTKIKIKMNPVFAVSMWLIVLTTGLSIIYGFWASIHQFYLPPEGVMYFYNAVSRPLWGMCLSWVIIACVSGYGGPINAFLSWKCFQPLSRLTFCAYLVHLNVIHYVYLSREIEFHFAINILVYYYIATLVLSLVISYLLIMTVEAPVARMMAIAFPKRKGKQQMGQQEIVISNDMNAGEKVNNLDENYEMASLNTNKLPMKDDVMISEKL